MRVTQDQMRENRRRILDAASRLFKEKGFEVVTVSEVMKAAGMTHGGFYGHFDSKEDLIANAVAHALAPAPGTGRDLRAFAEVYLSPEHCGASAEGCPTAALAALIRLQSPEARAAMTTGIRSQIERLSATVPGPDAAVRRREAIAGWSAMVGAVILARAVDDPALSGEILAQTLAVIGVAAEG